MTKGILNLTFTLLNLYVLPEVYMIGVCMQFTDSACTLLKGGVDDIFPEFIQPSGTHLQAAGSFLIAACTVLPFSRIFLFCMCSIIYPFLNFAETVHRQPLELR
jgi:hypothetical protein